MSCLELLMLLQHAVSHQQRLMCCSRIAARGNVLLCIIARGNASREKDRRVIGPRADVLTGENTNFKNETFSQNDVLAVYCL